MIPIIIKHDHQDVIGMIQEENGKLMASFNKPISKDELFQVFPTAGIRVLMSEDGFVQEAELVEFSFGLP